MEVIHGWLGGAAQLHDRAALRTTLLTQTLSSGHCARGIFCDAATISPSGKSGLCLEGLG
jgi:hypothetical protein